MRSLNSTLTKLSGLGPWIFCIMDFLYLLLNGSAPPNSIQFGEYPELKASVKKTGGSCESVGPLFLFIWWINFIPLWPEASCHCHSYYLQSAVSGATTEDHLETTADPQCNGMSSYGHALVHLYNTSAMQAILVAFQVQFTCNTLYGLSTGHLWFHLPLTVSAIFCKIHDFVPIY